jgi:hypothetical protein
MVVDKGQRRAEHQEEVIKARRLGQGMESLHLASKEVRLPCTG